MLKSFAARNQTVIAQCYRGFGESITRIARRQFPQTQARLMAATRAPGDDPLEVLRDDCISHGLCDEAGFRLPEVHWTFSVALGLDGANTAPNLRTVGFQRISTLGIDFVVKNGSEASKSFVSGCPVSILALHGRYLPGEKAEQWRAEGYCEVLPLNEILGVIPAYTITGMVTSKRLENEMQNPGESDRMSVDSTSRLTELMQQTRNELENGTISDVELANSIMACRFLPDRVERMSGGSDSVIWDRWEWQRETGPWAEPRWLLPH